VGHEQDVFAFPLVAQICFKLLFVHGDSSWFGIRARVAFSGDTCRLFAQ
jgi:hypothetical protein